MRKFLTTVFALFMSCSLWAGISYNFSQAQESYQPLNDGMAITEAYNDEMFIVALPGHYRLFGEEFTFADSMGLYVGVNGFTVAFNSTKEFAIDPFLADLKLKDNSSIRYKMEGMMGQQVLKIEWANMGFEKGGEEDYISFQMWLYEETGNIEFRYGPSSVSKEAYGMASGPQAGYLYGTYNFAQIQEIGMLYGNPQSAKVNNMASPYLAGTPAEGTVYRFTDKSNAATIAAPQLSVHIEVYPNPASEQITLSLQTQGQKNITYWLEDMSGRMVSTRRVAASSATQIDISGLEPGVYLLQLQDGGQRYIKRIVKN